MLVPQKSVGFPIVVAAEVFPTTKSPHSMLIASAHWSFAGGGPENSKGPAGRLLSPNPQKSVI